MLVVRVEESVTWDIDAAEVESKVLLVPVAGKDDNAPLSTGLASTVTIVSVAPQV
jgi:hypothetical protein